MQNDHHQDHPRLQLVIYASDGNQCLSSGADACSSQYPATFHSHGRFLSIGTNALWMISVSSHAPTSPVPGEPTYASHA